MSITNERNDYGVKDSANQYRQGGNRVLFVDGRNDEVTLRVVASIRAKGFKCWRTKDQVWVHARDLTAMVAAGCDDGN